MILAFNFQSPANLFFLPLVALPLIIHLLNRRKYRVVRWAAMDCLLKAMRKQRRRMRMENLLLVLLRMAAIACLILACGQPVSEKKAGASVSRRDNICLLMLVDTSYSMAYQEAGQSLLDEAKSLAKDRLSRLGQSDRLMLFSAAEFTDMIFDDHITEEARLIARDFIDSLDIAHAALNCQAMLAQVEQRINALAEEEELPVEVVVLTDLQADDWMAPGHHPDPALARQFSALRDAGVRFNLVNLTDAVRPNVGMVDLKLDASAVVTDVPVVIRSTLKNWSMQPAGPLQVDLVVDGHQVQSRTITLDAGATEGLLFRHTFRDPGVHGVTLSFRSDSLAVDNRRFSVVHVRKKIDLLLVDGDHAEEKTRQSTFYLEAALSRDPLAIMDALSPFAVETVPAQLLTGSRLARCDGVVLCNVSRLPDIAELTALLNRGGSVLIFLGPNVAMDFYNDVLFHPETGLCPIRLLGIAGDPARQNNVFMEPRALDHPMVSFVVDREEVAFDGPPVWRFYRTDPGDKVKTLVAYKNPERHPAILEADLPQGSVVVVTTTADDQWTSLPKWPDFVAIMHELLTYQVSAGGTRRNLYVGWPFRRIYPAGAYAEEVRIRAPDRQVSRTSLRPLSAGDRGYFQLVHDNTAKAGLYHVTLHRKRSLDALMESRFPGEDMFAVNLTGKEGDLTGASHALLTSCYGDAAPSVQTIGEEGAEQAAGLNKPPTWWFPLLMAMLFLFVGEGVCAALFGRRQR